MGTRTGITTETLNVQTLHDWVKHESCGAVVTFSGITRDNVDGKHVKELSYDCYKPRAEKTLNALAEKALDQFKGTEKVAIVHRIGVVPLSEESVVIAVSAAHRREAWEAAEWCLEEIKASAEIWKKEVFIDGSESWVTSCTPRKVSGQ